MKTTVKAILASVSFPAKPVNGQRMAVLHLEDDQNCKPFAFLAPAGDGRAFAKRLGEESDGLEEHGEPVYVNVTVEWPDEEEKTS